MKCKYCHKPVGLFSSKHKECELKHFALLSEIKEILQYISGIISKNGRNDAKQLNVSVVTVSNDAKPKMLKKQRKAELSRRTVCKSLPDEK